MRLRTRTIATVLASALALGATTMLGACNPSIGEINLRPDSHYQEEVTFKGRIVRTQQLRDEMLLEIADANEHRILVHSITPVDAGVDDWVTVTGVLLPEMRVGGAILYDVVAAERIKPTYAPLLRDLM